MNIAEINMFPPDQVQLERQRALHEERNYFIFPHRLADGSVRTVEVHSSPIVIEDKTLLFSIIHDITERKQAEEKIYLQNLALKTASHAVVVTDKDGAVQWANQAWCELTGYSENEVIGKNMRILKSGKQDETFYKSLWNTILAGEVWRGELTNKRKDGELYVEEQTITPVLDEQGDVKNFIAIKQDITERKQMEDELRELGTRDALTGLYNRRYFEEEMARQERGRLFPISLIMADVDGLKKINDQRGHDVGDELIKRIAQILTTAFRAEDVVARIGGDEFAALLPNSDAKAAESALVRVRQVLQEYNASRAGPSISLSLGVSSAEKSTPLYIVLKRADVNMYREKRRKDDDSSSAQK
jgi:diguanylate cyclase (GGDEF)-like protein/PAS domain S-box-containing protein